MQKISVPTNWRDELITAVNTGPVDELYGKLTSDFIGGGRPSYGIPQISKSLAAHHIKETHRAGLRFNYLLNATCLENLEWTRTGQRQIRLLLDWLDAQGVYGVTVAMPYLLELIKKRYPRLKVFISTSARINALDRARYWQDMGADRITLDSVDTNRNFRLIRLIRRAVKCQLQLIANVNCLYNCANRFYHCNAISHASQSMHAKRGFFLDYSYLMCSYQRVKDPVNLIRADWIRPEDLGLYEDMGIERIKLVDRGMPTDILSSIVRAYVARRYDGNLMDLFITPRKTLMRREFGLAHKLRYFFRPAKINFLALYKAKDLFFDIFYIDNRLLDGFIRHFIDNDCSRSVCGECNYCQEVSRKAIKFDTVLQQRLAQAYKQFLENMVSGAVFRYV